jgi:hypothetical protein
VPFSPSFVTQPKTKQTNMRTRARQGMFCGYPKNTSDGIYTTYFKGTRSTQNTRHCVFGEWHGLRHEATPPVQLEQRAAELEARVLDLERRSAPVSAASKTAAPPLTAKAVASDSYFRANTAQTVAQSRDTDPATMRADARYAMRPGNQLTSAWQENGKLKNYTNGDFEYDLCLQLWCIPSDDPPPALTPSGAAFAIGGENWLQRAEADAVHPIVDYTAVRGITASAPFLTVQQESPTSVTDTTGDTELLDRATTINSAAAQLAITEREIIMQHIRSDTHPAV